MMSIMPRACCRASHVHIPTASKTQRSSVVDVLDMFSNSQGAPHNVTKAWRIWNGRAIYGKVSSKVCHTSIYQNWDRFRCRFGIRCRFGAESTEVKWDADWMGCTTSDWQSDWQRLMVFDGFFFAKFETATWQLLHSASTASTASTPPWDHPIPCQKSSAPAICRQLHTIHDSPSYIDVTRLMLQNEKFITPRQDIEIVNQVSALLYCLRFCKVCHLKILATSHVDFLDLLNQAMCLLSYSCPLPHMSRAWKLRLCFVQHHVLLVNKITWAKTNENMTNRL